MEIHKDIKAVYAKSRTEWRRWLNKNHAKEKSVWLILYHKSSATPSINYNDAVEEALCFGWIDSRANKRDTQSSYLFFAPRKPKSKWSKSNQERVEKLTKQGLMTAAGQAMIDLAKKTGTWDAYAEVHQAGIPDDLQQLFDKNKKAFKHYLDFPPSSKRIILDWIRNAKRPETRQKRIEETVKMAAKNIRVNHYQK